MLDVDLPPMFRKEDGYPRCFSGAKTTDALATFTWHNQ